MKIKLFDNLTLIISLACVIILVVYIAVFNFRPEVTIYLNDTFYYAVSGNDTISKHCDLNEVIKDLETYKIVGIEDLTCK